MRLLNKKAGRKKVLIFAFFLFLFLVLLAIYAADKSITNAADGKLYSETNSIPYNKVGLLLGTAKYLKNGLLNYYYQYRIEAAEALLKSGKIKYLVISGDNSTVEYNEPETMKQDLIQKGIDSNLIYLDYAGFRTFDSIVRLREIFGQTSTTIISQPFHNERAIFIAGKENVQAIGFNARDVTGNPGLRVQLREKLARVKVYIDYLTNKQPKYLGPPVPIP
jgi:SanA protein